MNYEAIGRYTIAKRTALAQCALRNRLLFDLKRWADHVGNSDQLVALDTDIGAQLMLKITIHNEAFDAAVIEANAVAQAASERELSPRLSYFKA